MTGDSDTVDMQPAKRQKVDVACDLCRAKKIKCDSIRPVCGPCAKKKSNSTLCSWESSVVRSSQPSRAEVLKLRRRIKELEEQVVNQSDSANNRNNSTNNNTSEISNINQPSEGNDNNNNDNINSENNNHNNSNNITNNNNNDTNDNTNGDVTGASRITPAAQSVQQDDICSIISDWAKAGSRIQLTPHDQHSASPDICGQTQNSTKNSRIPNSVSSEPTIGSVGSTSVDSDFYGRASALDFLTQMRNAVHQKLGITNPTTSTAPYDIQTRILGASATQRYKPIHYVLPGRRQADKLLYVYWNTLHTLYPFLDKQDFIARYETLWVHRDSDEDDPVFLCALNLVFALSSHLDEDITPDERHASATTFFERAEESMDLWHLNTLQSVQMLLLLSIYFQSICALSQSWMIIGVATRTAQSLGLHLSGTKRKQVPQEQQELVQRVWQTCVLLDRMAAMTHGRPSMTTGSMHTKGRMSRFDGHDFFLQSSRLFEISHETLGGLYSDNLELRCPNRELLETLIGRTTMDNKWFILDTDRRLLDWYNNLPPYLKFKRGSLGSGSLGTFARQATILRQQYLHIKLLSLRPILSAYLSSEGDNSFTGSPTAPSLSEKIALQCSTTCVNLARELIEVSYSTCPNNPHLVGMTEAWWHNVLFIYSAATVLIAARLSPSILADVPEDTILTSYHRANKVLKSFQVFTPTIQRMVVALDQVYQIIPGNYSRSRQQAQQSEMHAGGYQDLSMQAEAQGQDLLAQDLLFAAQPADKHRTDSLMDGISDEAIGHDINFDVTDFSWLTTLPFEF